MSERGSDKKAPRRHRGLVWTLIVVTSVLSVLAITANWLQSEVLDEEQWHDTTEEIVTDAEVRDALSRYMVEQLYANVDVSAQLEQVLPPPANKLSGPAAGLVQQLAQNSADRLVEAPRIQALIVGASDRAHGQLIDLLDDKKAYIETNNGQVVLDLRGVIRDLAVQLGLDPGTVERIQTFVGTEIADLNTKLAELDSSIKTLNQSLAGYTGGELSSSAQQDVDQAQEKISSLESSVSGIQKKLNEVAPKLPSKLGKAASQFDAALSQLSGRLAPLNTQLTAVKEQPTEKNVTELRETLGTLELRIAKIRARPILKNPGQLVLVEESQLEGAQSATRLFRHLGFVLPLLVTVLFLLALYLAQGWRREALIDIGAAIVVSGFVLLVALNWIGNNVVETLAASDANQPAVNSIWDILSDGLYAKLWFAISTGILLILAGMLAGPGKVGSKIREWLAPALRDHVPLVYIGVAVLFLIRLSFMPAPQSGNILPQVLLAVLVVLGVEALRRQTAAEFPKTS